MFSIYLCKAAQGGRQRLFVRRRAPITPYNSSAPAHCWCSKIHQPSFIHNSKYTRHTAGVVPNISNTQYCKYNTNRNLWRTTAVIPIKNGTFCLSANKLHCIKCAKLIKAKCVLNETNYFLIFIALSHDLAQTDLWDRNKNSRFMWSSIDIYVKLQPVLKGCVVEVVLQ